MSTAASLSLLKGATKSAVDDELDKNDAPAAEAAEEGDEEVTVDVDKMDSKALDALVAEHEIDVPANWKKMKVGEKRAWLKEQFEEADEGDLAPEGEALDPAYASPAPAAEEAAVPAVAEEEATKPKGKAKPPAKKAVTGTVEQPGEDLLADLVHEVENMTEKAARDTVKQLSNETEMTCFKMGGVLSVIQAHNWFEPYASFREYVEKELGLHYRKATYWVSIYNSLSESGVPWAKVKHIGWTKLKEIAEVLTVENVDEWVKIAEAQTTLQLVETVKGFKSKDAPKALEDQTAKTVTTMTFKVHEDQKETVKAALDKAKGVSGTQVDTAALEFICLDYLGAQTMAEKLAAMGIDKALEALEKAFPSTEFAVSLPE